MNIDETEFVVGQESIDNESRKKYNEMYQDMLQPMFGTIIGMRSSEKPSVLFRTSDQINWRIYLTSDIYLSTKVLNAVCRFLDSRQSNETVTFILGVKSEDYQLHMLGSILSAMISCKATIITVAAGYCSFFETAIWCYGKDRKILRYGALTFSKAGFVEICPKYAEYFETIYNRAIEVGILSEEDVKTIKETGKDKMLISSDLNK